MAWGPIFEDNLLHNHDVSMVWAILLLWISYHIYTPMCIAREQDLHRAYTALRREIGVMRSIKQESNM